MARRFWNDEIQTFIKDLMFDWNRRADGPVRAGGHAPEKRSCQSHGTRFLIFAFTFRCFFFRFEHGAKRIYICLFSRNLRWPLDFHVGPTRQRRTRILLFFFAEDFEQNWTISNDNFPLCLLLLGPSAPKTYSIREPSVDSFSKLTLSLITGPICPSGFLHRDGLVSFE